jgi:hypothetical protein
LAMIVPSLYYDIIARVMPGAAFLKAVIPLQNLTITESSSDWIRLLLLLGGGYLAGLILPLSALIVLPVDAFIWLRSDQTFRDWLLGSPNDAIGTKSAEAGSTIGKMQAEATLCGNVAAGLAVAMALPKTMCIPLIAYVHDRYLLLIGFAFLILVANFRQAAYRGRQKNLYRMHVDKDLGPLRPLYATSVVNTDPRSGDS